MSEWNPVTPGHAASPEAGFMPVCQQRVPLRFAALANEETAPGLVCLGAYLQDRLLGMTEVTPATLAHYTREDWSTRPMRLAMPSAVAANGEIRATLCALMPLAFMPPMAETLGELPADDESSFEGGDSPWAASAGSQQFEQAIAGTDTTDHPATSRPATFLVDGQEVALVPIGHVVRLAPNRQFPNDTQAEAHAMLRSLIAGRAVKLIDKVLENEGF